MKAIRVHEFGPPDVMKLEDIGDLKPNDDQILVKLVAIGVNPTEAYMRSGDYGGSGNMPFTPGTDAAGIVEAVGKNIAAFDPGDRVYTSGSLTGTYAEKTLCTEDQVQPLPENVSFEQGAALGIPYATAYRALFQRAGIEPGETVLIHGGSGGVGSAAIQWARASGIDVIATGGTEQGRSLIAEQGASLVLDHNEADFKQKILSYTCDCGVDVVLEMLANVNLPIDLQVLGPHGRIVVIGNHGTTEINPGLLMMQEAEVLGVTLHQATDFELVSIHAAIVAGLETGALKPVIGKKFSLKDAAGAHREMMEAGAYGKIILLV